MRCAISGSLAESHALIVPFLSWHILLLTVVQLRHVLKDVTYVKVLVRGVNRYFACCGTLSCIGSSRHGDLYTPQATGCCSVLVCSALAVLRLLRC